MSCSKYGLQGLHAGIYIARETNGRLGEYQRFPSTRRPANSFYIALILLAQDSHHPTSPETKAGGRGQGNWKVHTSRTPSLARHTF